MDKPHPVALVVEDAKTDGEVLSRLLAALGCRTDWVRDGRAGVLAACSGSYDFVFMDIEMPRMNGLAATRAIQEQLGPNSPFIVAVSGHRGNSDRQACADAGMDYFIEKPVRKRNLETILA
ncbi:MAG: hypothetical protein QOD77_1458 [Thermoplasmata archaeon]|jgi:CheY-like chemotaxis protein|nr:hypothetical protein [Thermoplasmata archaeon]